MGSRRLTVFGQSVRAAQGEMVFTRRSGSNVRVTTDGSFSTIGDIISVPTAADPGRLRFQGHNPAQPSDTETDSAPMCDSMKFEQPPRCLHLSLRIFDCSTERYAFHFRFRIDRCVD